jgi:hypothetical protein
MAYDHVFPPIPAHGALLYQRPQRLRIRQRTVRLLRIACRQRLTVCFSDVSWGTKGDNKVSNDLGAVVVGKNKNEVEVVVPTEEKDINAAYEDAIHVLSTKPPKVEQKRNASTKQEDYYRQFRTKCV